MRPRRWKFFIILICACLSLAAADRVSATTPADCAINLRPIELSWDETPALGSQALARITTFTEETADKNTVKTLFWNVEGGITNSAFLLAGTGDPLSDNLLALINGPTSPDVIGLVEYRRDRRVLSTLALQALDQRYPHQYFKAYDIPGSSDYGVLVMSRIPTQNVSMTPMPWVPQHLNPEEQRTFEERYTLTQDGQPLNENYYQTDRPYLQLSFKVGGRDATVGVAHMTMPWNNLRQREGLLRATYEMTYGTSNPIINQINSILRSSVRERETPYMLVGDFNISASLLASSNIRSALATVIGDDMPDQSLAYTRLSNELNDAFGGRHPHSFPAASSPQRQQLPFRYMPVKLDHAFVSPSVQNSIAEVLPLRGSDHYPVWAGMEVR